MSDIFLSFASADYERVRLLVRALERHGWSVWWDRTIPPGKTFDQVIEAALGAARCVMVVWSRASIVSDWVRVEADEGKQRGILVPVVIDAEVRLPLQFRLIQAARLLDWQDAGPHLQFEQLLQAVTDLIGPPASVGSAETRVDMPTPPPPEAPPPRDEAPSVSFPPQNRPPEIFQKPAHEQKPEPLITKQPPPARRRLVWMVGIAVCVLITVLYFTRLKPPDSPISQPAPEPSPVATRPGAPEPARPPQTITNSLGMEFVLIPDGKFLMGSANGDKDESPVHTVQISHAFYLGKYEVTQGQWEAVMGTNPSKFMGEPKRPVEQVSWEDAQKFIGKLNEQLNAKEGGTKYRLPTEAEWEYAARAGSTTAYSFGDDETQLGEYAWYYQNAGNTTHPVGQRMPNAWGLYDMHGNVWEWVQDWYGAYAAATVTDPQGPSSGSIRVIRGGSWFRHEPRYCRVASRGLAAPGYRIDSLGLRLLRTAP